MANFKIHVKVSVATPSFGFTIVMVARRWLNFRFIFVWPKQLVIHQMRIHTTQRIQLRRNIVRHIYQRPRAIGMILNSAMSYTVEARKTRLLHLIAIDFRYVLYFACNKYKYIFQRWSLCPFHSHPVKRFWKYFTILFVLDNDNFDIKGNVSTKFKKINKNIFGGT